MNFWKLVQSPDQISWHKRIPGDKEYISRFDTKDKVNSIAFIIGHLTCSQIPCWARLYTPDPEALLHKRSFFENFSPSRFQACSVRAHRSAIGLFYARILGMGYNVIMDALDSQFTFKLLLILLFLKTLDAVSNALLQSKYAGFQSQIKKIKLDSLVSLPEATL